jgi:menaquinone-dependent protoporphyrinogen oxidase
MKVLVVYASKYGSTKGIAEFIGEKLRQRGMEADVMEVGTVRNAEEYQAFVIGSALYMFHWLKEAKQFVLGNKGLLAARSVWLFSSGPLGRETKDSKGRDYKDISGPKELSELQVAVKPRDHRVFFGALDGSRLTGTIGFGYRMARLSKSAREVLPDGDFRDWKEIEAWTNSIVDVLRAQLGTVSSP